MTETSSFGMEYIISTQRNRHPVLFLDKVLKLDPGKSVEAIKNFSYNEWFFPAHFDDEPLVPGFILLETLAQSFILSFLSLEANVGHKTNLYEVSHAKFLRKVVPGDQLVISSDLESFRFGLAIGKSVARVGEEVACEARFKVLLPLAVPSRSAE